MANQHSPNTIAELARKALADNPHLTTPAALADYLRLLHEQVAQANRGATYITCKRVLDKAGVQPSIVDQVLEEATAEEQEEPWRVEDGNFKWSSKQGAFCRAVEEVDEMFFAYSKHGRNKTQVQMINDFGLSNWEWNTLKARLKLQKNSNVFSEYTVSITPKDELEPMMEAKMARRYDRLGPLLERAHTEVAVNQLNKVLLRQDEKQASLQRLALELADQLPVVKYRFVARTNTNYLGGPEHLVVPFADPHVGAQIKQLLNAPRYDERVLYRYADQLIAAVNARHAANVYLAGLGDFIESFSGLNHCNTWLQLDAEKVGAGGIKAALEFVSYLVERIFNVREIWGVSGNHDRTSADNKLDTKGEAAMLLFMLLAERYRKTGVQVLYRYDVLVRVIDNICYLLTHGHLGVGKGDKGLTETIARHRVPGHYCVAILGHLHSRITKLDTDDSRVLHAPSLFTGNTYSSENGWSTLAGFITCENAGGSGYPRVIDEPLYPAAFALNTTAQQSML
jgi:hypothetical protein